MATKEKEKAEKDDAEEKEGPETKEQAKDNGEDAEESKSKDKKDKDTKSVPSLGTKIFRASLFTFLATFLTAFLFADPIPNGLRVDFDLLASIKLALIAGVIAAVLRAVAGMLPIFADD